MKSILFQTTNWERTIRLEQQTVAIAKYMIATQSTIRDTAKKFDMAKSTVHTYLTQLLPSLNPPLFIEVRKILDKNWEERCVRGGMAIKLKYQNMKKC